MCGRVLGTSAPQPLDDGEDVFDEVIEIARRVLPSGMLSRAPPWRVCSRWPRQRRDCGRVR